MNKRLYPLLLALLLLSACTAPVANEEAPPPSTSPAVLQTETRAPLPTEPAAAPIAMDTAQSLADLAGKEVDLWRGNLGVGFLDNYPGVREYTSFDDAGEYVSIQNLVHYSRRYLDGYCYESFLCAYEDIVGGGYNTLIITDAGAGDGFRQELRVDANVSPDLRDAALSLADLNGDGHMDVKLFHGADRGGYQTYTALLWGAESGCYYVEPSFTDITEPVFDESNEIWWGGHSAALLGAFNAAEYLDGRFVVTHTIDISFEAETYTITERTLERGELRKVAEATLPYEDRDTATPPELLTDYAARQASWKGWAGCNFKIYYPGW